MKKMVYTIQEDKDQKEKRKKKSNQNVVSERISALGKSTSCCNCFQRWMNCKSVYMFLQTSNSI